MVELQYSVTTSSESTPSTKKWGKKAAYDDQLVDPATIAEEYRQDPGHHTGAVDTG